MKPDLSDEDIADLAKLISRASAARCTSNVAGSTPAQ
jgi:cytochrome c553